MLIIIVIVIIIIIIIIIIISLLILEDWNFHARNTVSKNSVLKHCILVLRRSRQKKTKNFDLEVSNLEVILLVLVAFMEFIHINEVVIDL